MSSKTQKNGTCLCGSIKFTASNSSNNIGACHCQMCQKWGGGPFMAVDCGKNVSFEGKDFLSIFGSSDWAERGFCRKCGSHLFYRLKQTDQHFMPVGLFQTDNSLVFDHQIFIDKKPPFYSFENITKKLTEKEFIDQYSSP